MFSLAGLYDLAETLLQRGQWVGFVVGIAAGTALGSWVCWFLCKHWMPSAWKTKFETLSEQNRDLAHQHEIVSGQLASATSERDVLKTQSDRYSIQLESAEKSTARLSSERDGLHRESAISNDRRARLEIDLATAEEGRAELEAKFTNWLNISARRRWEHPATPNAPRFRPLHARQMPIISVVNLKGGVGKTTITANLGATLAKEYDLRVLMIDLDWQGSLSALCLSPEELQDVRKSRRIVSDVLRNGIVDRHEAVRKCATRLDDLGVGDAYLLATEDELDDVESQVMAHWLLGVSGDDVRFRLREALHDPAISAEFDIVLIDCPPRLSTGCVNALAASDFVLSPVLLEQVSFEAAPKLLRWLKKYHTAFCPELSILGMIGNRVRYHTGKPVRKQMAIWEKLKDHCRHVWGADVRFFDDQMIRAYADIPHRLAALVPDHAAPWNDLAKAILKELPPYARRRPPTVHPVAHPPVSGVRS